MKRSLTGMGLQFEARISEARATALLAPHRLPRMGHATVVASKPDATWPTFTNILEVQNISGKLVLASASVTNDQWLDVFGIDPKGG